MLFLCNFFCLSEFLGVVGSLHPGVGYTLLSSVGLTHVLLPWHKLTGICSQVGLLQGVIAVIPGVSVANSPLFCS